MWRRIADFFSTFWKIILLWIIIIAAVVLGLYFNVDKKVIAGAVFIFGILSNAFAGLAAMVALVPFIGPLIIKVLSLPLFWILNGLGYFVSILAIKKGYTKDVVNYRVLTVAFLLGVVFGFILGRVI